MELGGYIELVLSRYPILYGTFAIQKGLVLSFRHRRMNLSLQITVYCTLYIMVITLVLNYRYSKSPEVGVMSLHIIMIKFVRYYFLHPF